MQEARVTLNDVKSNPESCKRRLEEIDKMVGTLMAEASRVFTRLVFYEPLTARYQTAALEAINTTLKINHEVLADVVRGLAGDFLPPGKLKEEAKEIGITYEQALEDAYTRMREQAQWGLNALREGEARRAENPDFLVVRRRP